MSLQLAAQHLASRGRGDDSVLVHMTPGEVNKLQDLAMAHGGSLTINPETGLPEAGFLSSILPTIIGIALAPATGGASLGITEAWQTAALVGGVEALRTKDIGKGIMAGLGAYGGANIGAGLGAMGADQAAMAAYGAQAAAGEEAAQIAAAQARQEALKATGFDALKNIGAGAEAAFSSPGKFVTAMGGMQPTLKAAGMAFGPAVLAAENVRKGLPQTTTQMTSPTARITPYRIDQFGNIASAGSYTPEKFAEMGGFSSLYNQPPAGAEGGSVHSGNSYAEGGDVMMPPGSTSSYQRTSMSPGMLDFAQRSEPVVRMANGGTPFAATREQVLSAYKANPLAELNPNEEAINYWMGQGLGSFNDVVKSARAESPGLATFIDAARNPAATTAATTPFATAETMLPNYLGLNAVAAGAPTTFVSSSAPAGYNYAAAQAKTQNEQAVNEIYNRVLGRQAEQGGLDYWAGLLNQGAKLSDVESQIKNVASNIGVKVDPTQLATPTAAQLAAQKSILADPLAAALAAAKSGIAAGMTDQQIADMVNMQYGKSFSAQNVADFMKAQGLTRPTKPQVPVIPVTPTPELFPGATPGVISTGDPFQPVAPTMSEVKTAYEQGGGSTRMPTITDIKPTDRMYSQGQAVGLIRDYLKSNPNAMYRDVVAFANSRGIPEMQARAAYNEFRFTDMSPGMQGIYDYLMGRGPAPTKPYVPGGGPLMRSYREVMGLPAGYEGLRPVNLTGDQSAVSKGVPKEVPSIKDPSGKQYPDLAAFYFSANPDVQKAYETDPQAKTMTPEDYVNFHWSNFGQKEKRPGYYEELAAKPAEAATISGGASGGLGSIIRAGVLGAAAGGGNVQQYNLGGYSDGGRLLRGPGDGVSDSIPATIGGKQPARLADGEFVVPARIVSELGNGSTEAGARKLYAMMDRVQAARKKSIGKGKVAKNSRADKYLPA